MTKMTSTLAALAAAALPFSLPAFAAPVDPAAVPPSETAPAGKANRAQRICVVEKVIGSNVNRKTCKTRADWIAEQGVDPLAAR